MLGDKTTGAIQTSQVERFNQVNRSKRLKNENSAWVVSMSASLTIRVSIRLAAAAAPKST